MGPPLPPDVVRGAVLLRANALARGLSAVRLELLQRLVSDVRAGLQRGACLPPRECHPSNK